MKSKFLYGAMALATVLSACTSEVLEPTTTDFTGVKGHDLVSEGMTITTKFAGKDTRVTKEDGKVLWETTDRLGLAWYDVAGNIVGVQENADYDAKKGTDADKKLYANNILSVNDDLSGFQTRANIYQGAYFVYSPWAYMAQIGELKFVVDGVQKKSFETELLNNVPWLSGTRYIAAADAPKDGDFEQTFNMNPVQNACKVIATSSDGVKKAFAAYSIGSTTLTATDESFDGKATGLGTNIFAASMTVDPNALPDEDEYTNEKADKAVKVMVTPEYGSAADAATTELEIDCSLANEENNIRVFMFPTNGENYKNAAGDGVIIPATTFYLPVEKDGKQLGYFEITKNDKDAENVKSVVKFGKFLTPVLTDADGKYIAGGYDGSVGVDPTPEIPGEPEIPGYWEYPEGVTPTPEPDPAYVYVDPETGEKTIGLEVTTDPVTGEVTKTWHWIDTVGGIWHEPVPGTPGTPGTPGIPEKPGKTLTEILRTDAGQATFVNLPIKLTADNFHFYDYISNIDEWNERVALVDALYGDEKGVVEFILDGEVDFTNEIPVPACATTLKVTAVEGTPGSMKVVKGDHVVYPAIMEGAATAVDLHEGDTSANPEFIVGSSASLDVATATKGIKFGTEKYVSVLVGDGVIFMTTTASAVDMSATVGAKGNEGGIYIYEYATENVADGKAAVVTSAEGTSVTYLVDEASLVDAGAIDNLLANAPVSDFWVGKSFRNEVSDIVLTMNNSTSTEGINLKLINGFIYAAIDVAFRNVYSSQNSGITAKEKDITLQDVEVADGKLTTSSNNISTLQIHSEGKGEAGAFITIDGTAALTKVDAEHAGGLNIEVAGKGVVTGVKTPNPIVKVYPGVESKLTSEGLE
ncbi:MAG: hypothetical protein J5661_04995 [Bacteroidaceae bacterium]|nr:hypothetical protein [Bacteroidaceae bacterium]